MQLLKHKQGECIVIAAKGKLDGSTSSKFEAEVIEWLGGGDKLFVLDLAGISFVSSAGLRVLLYMAKRAKRTGIQIVLSSPSAIVTEVLEISNFTALFTVCATLDAAVLALQEMPVATADSLAPRR